MSDNMSMDYMKSICNRIMAVAVVMIIFATVLGRSLTVNAVVADEYKAPVTMNRKEVNLKVGTSSKVSVMSYDGDVEWKISKKSIAKVSGNGKVTGLKKGKCYLTATLDDGTKYKIPVKVTKKLDLKSFTTIGHRGNPDKYPENTIISFKSAMDRGRNGVEMDIFATKSGDLMVFHDKNLERMCDVDVSTVDVSVSNRKNYPITNGSYAKKHKVYIPTLEESLKAMKKKDAIVFVHVKNPGDFSSEMTTKLVSTINSCGMTDNCVIFCSNKSFLTSLGSSGINRGFLSFQTSLAGASTYMDWCAENGVTYFFCFQRSNINLKIVNYAHDKDLKVVHYKTRTVKDVQYLNDIGVDIQMLYHDFK